ncbi:hypothetical protein LTR97_003372 [Elasticomyces elasticus]|uniref:Uncharacterized protein n=1 Tax=Elasticomyces elasticus TaxID=574655 RepID=A0AAN8A4H3_9PEZI|nr:hypothetical protein LTR97_003372 [Elasticomyces elasticus]
MPSLSVDMLIAAGVLAAVILGFFLREMCERFDLEFKGMYRRPAVVQIQYIRKPSLLLTLPPELRNRIWEHSLVSPEPPVRIDNETWRQPPLIRTCKQIRQEAAPMYYGLNKFSIIVTDLDFKTDIHFCRSARSCVDFPPDTSYYSSGPVQAKWESLMEGAKAVHSGMIPGCQHNMAQTGVLAAAAGALKIARRLRGVPWEQVEEVLIVYKSAVVSSGTGWNWV